MTQKTNTKKIIILALLLSIFIIGKNLSFAESGSVDTSKNNKIKVCRDVTCGSPPPGIIDFNNSGDSSFVIDTEKGLSGKVWGGDLGWVTFNPPYGGVFFADPKTGLLKGTAWSETSGAINFSVTGQSVSIDPKTGLWDGWAWASGPYGGWIKFNCKDISLSCLHTTWRNTVKGPTFTSYPQPASPTPSPVPPPVSSPAPSTTPPPILTLLTKTKDLSDNVKKLTGNISTPILKPIDSKSIESVLDQMTNVRNQIINNLGTVVNEAKKKIDDTIELIKKTLPQNGIEPASQGSLVLNTLPPAPSPVTPSPTLGIGENFVNSFINLYKGTKQTIKEESEIMYKDYKIFIWNAENLLNKSAVVASTTYNFLYKTNDKMYSSISQFNYKIYDSYSSDFINLKASILDGINYLSK